MPLINTTGRHEVTAKKATFGESQKGTPFIEISFEDNAAASINGWLYLSDAAFERTVKVLREVFGFDGNFETLPAQIEGKRCSIETEEEEDDKKVLRMRVKWINPLRTVIPLKGGNTFLQSLSQKAARIPVEQRAKAPAPQKAPVPAAGNVQNFGDFPQG